MAGNSLWSDLTPSVEPIVISYNTVPLILRKSGDQVEVIRVCNWLTLYNYNNFQQTDSLIPSFGGLGPHQGAHWRGSSKQIESYSAQGDSSKVFVNSSRFDWSEHGQNGLVETIRPETHGNIGRAGKTDMFLGLVNQRPLPPYLRLQSILPLPKQHQMRRVMRLLNVDSLTFSTCGCFIIQLFQQIH